MANSSWIDPRFDSWTGLDLPENTLEDELATQRMLGNIRLPPSWHGHGNGTDFESLLQGGLEADVSLDWEPLFLGSNPYTQSTLTPLDFQLRMDLPTLPVAANCSDTPLVGAAPQACDSTVSSSVLWSSPSASELSHPTPTPSSETREPQRLGRRTRKKRVAQPMREIRKKEKPEICTECAEGFPYKRDLDRHLRSHHREQGIPTDVFECFHCGSTCGERHNLVKHLKKKHRDLHEGKSGLRSRFLRVGSSLVSRGWLEEDVEGAV